ncbi:hypothetical protein [Acidicapsa acidisoli]|uniref:hypothetical protein n=1 Tax=Acidicapsa acidisoli TaxID=1615681 RepID=UPI0021E03B54|nr:hypothetical protein [Acidicapsa acidisoli]
MATTWNTSNLVPDDTGSKSANSIPWYLWCSVLAVTSVSIGAHWDVSWHRSIGRDTFWTPAHIAIYACGVLAAISCGYLVLFTTFRKPASMVASSVEIFGFRAPLGAFIASWGGIAMLTSAPFDNWWHNAYGLDVKIVSPPHTLLMLGVFAVSVGTLIMLLGSMNRAEQAGNAMLARHLQWMLLYIGGLMVVFQMFFRMEYTWDVYLHGASAYEAIAIGMPTLFAVLWQSSRSRWACTWATLIYTVFLEAAVLILPLFPAEPKLGPVFQQVTHFIPPKFPILLIVPAIAMDLLWNSTRTWKPWLTALASGPVFVLSLVAVEWPFADFLMTKAAANRFFGTTYFGYPEPPTSFDVLRRFVDPQHGATLWNGLALAMLFAFLSTWLGIALGRWMRAIQR